MVADMVAFALPSNEAEPVTSPDSAKVLDVASLVAVSALPVTLPVRSAVTVLNMTSSVVSTDCPMAMVGVALSPVLLLNVIPVPAVSCET